jgi:sigma-E factor negative regulatory protein RseC
MRGRGKVVSRTGAKAKIQVTVGGGCAGCASHGTCMSSGRVDREITVLNDYNALEGDLVVFESDPGKVVLASFLLWVVPILAMIVGYFAGEALGGGVISVVAAFVFLALSFAALALVDRMVSGGRMFHPRIIAVVGPDDDPDEVCGG